MSKKKAKAKKAPKKKAASRAVTTRTTAATTSGITRQATVIIYRAGGTNKIRTVPQRLYANPGDRVEWSVLNLVDGSDVPVTISWPGPNPFGSGPITFKSAERFSLDASSGEFKYVVSALDAKEDPEILIPDV